MGLYCSCCCKDKLDSRELLTSFADFLPSELESLGNRHRLSTSSFRDSASFSINSPNKLVMASMMQNPQQQQQQQQQQLQHKHNIEGASYPYNNDNLNHLLSDAESMQSPSNSPVKVPRRESFSSPRDKRKYLNWSLEVPIEKWKFIRVDKFDRIRSLLLSGRFVHVHVIIPFHRHFFLTSFCICI